MYIRGQLYLQLGNHNRSFYQRLQRELRVWQRLEHENVLPLCGTTSDFGPYTSMVCPWMDNGSVSRYLERCGDILSVSDRLQLVSLCVYTVRDAL